MKGNLDLYCCITEGTFPFVPWAAQSIFCGNFNSDFVNNSTDWWKNCMLYLTVCNVDFFNPCEYLVFVLLKKILDKVHNILLLRCENASNILKIATPASPVTIVTWRLYQWDFRMWQNFLIFWPITVLCFSEPPFKAMRISKPQVPQWTSPNTSAHFNALYML